MLTTKSSFPFTGAFPALRVGAKTIEGGDISPDGKTMTVSVPKATCDALPSDADVSLVVQASSPAWKFGPLKK